MYELDSFFRNCDARSLSLEVANGRKSHAGLVGEVFLAHGDQRTGGAALLGGHHPPSKPLQKIRVKGSALTRVNRHVIN